MINKHIGRLYNILLLAGLYVTAPFLWLARYNQPAADDYYSAVRDAHAAFIPTLKDIYVHWSGRYFAVLVSRINPLLFNAAAYKWYAVVLILLTMVSLWLLLKQVTGKYLTAKQVAALTAAVTIIYLAAMPSTAEGFYWFSGAYIYQLANIFFLLLLVLLINLMHASNKTGRLANFVLALLCGICIMGCNEIALIITSCCLFFFTAYSYAKSKPNTAYFIVLNIVCWLAAAAAFFAPGNFERLNQQMNYSTSLVWTIAGGAVIAGIYTLQWLLQVLVFTLIYITLWGNMLAAKMVNKPGWGDIKFKPLVIIYISLLIIVQLFSVWAAGGSNLGRIENVIYLFFLLGYFFLLQVYLVQRRQRKAGKDVETGRLLRVIAIGIFFISMLDINNNISTAWLDSVSGKAAKYNSELNQRSALVSSCKMDTCFVPSLSSIPKTIFFTDIRSKTDSNGLWINASYANYYNHVFVVPTAQPPQPQQNMEILKNLGREIRQNVFR